MWRQPEQHKVHRPKNAEQLCLARVEARQHDASALIRSAFPKHYFLNVALQRHQLKPFSLAPTVPGQKLY
jgi:hypothetical protein